MKQHYKYNDNGHTIGQHWTRDDSHQDDVQSAVRHLWKDESREHREINASSYVDGSTSSNAVRGISFIRLAMIISCAICSWLFIGTENIITKQVQRTTGENVIRKTPNQITAKDGTSEYKSLLSSSGSFTPHIKYAVENDPSFIVLVTVSDGFEAMWYNWLDHFEALEIPNLPLHMFAEDDVSYEKCINIQSTYPLSEQVELVCLSPMTVLGGLEDEDKIHNSHRPKDYHTTEYKKMMSRRPTIVQYELENNNNTHIIFSDIDVVWRENPLPYFDDIVTGNVDILISVDGGIETMRTKGKKGDKVLPALCPGFMVLRSCPQTIEFVSKWRSLIEGKLRRNQPAFNSVASLYGWTYNRTSHVLTKQKTSDDKLSSLVVKCLSRMLFVGGDYYFKNMTEAERLEAVVVHANNIGPGWGPTTSGYENKIIKMKEYSLW